LAAATKCVSLSSGTESQGGSGKLKAGKVQKRFFGRCLQPDTAPAGGDILRAMRLGGG